MLECEQACSLQLLLFFVFGFLAFFFLLVRFGAEMQHKQRKTYNN